MYEYVIYYQPCFTLIIKCKLYILVPQAGVFTIRLSTHPRCVGSVWQGRDITLSCLTRDIPYFGRQSFNKSRLSDVTRPSLLRLIIKSQHNDCGEIAAPRKFLPTPLCHKWDR